MTPAVLNRPGSLFGDSAPAGPFGRRRLTLEERLDGALHAARTNGSTECPVCDARITSTRAGAECGGCGARLT